MTYSVYIYTVPVLYFTYFQYVLYVHCMLQFIIISGMSDDLPPLPTFRDLPGVEGSYTPTPTLSPHPAHTEVPLFVATSPPTVATTTSPVVATAVSSAAGTIIQVCVVYHRNYEWAQGLIVNKNLKKKGETECSTTLYII